MNDLVALHAKHDENIANLDVAKTSLADVSHELAKAKHELELVKDAPIVMCLNVMSVPSLSLI